MYRRVCGVNGEKGGSGHACSDVVGTWITAGGGIQTDKRTIKHFEDLHFARPDGAANREGRWQGPSHFDFAGGAESATLPLLSDFERHDGFEFHNEVTFTLPEAVSDREQNRVTVYSSITLTLHLWKW